MIPTIANTTTPILQPPTLVATPLPNAQAARVAYDAVAPSVSNPKVGDNAKQNAATPNIAQPSTPATSAAPLLSTPIPASFSTSSASLSASAIFATQALGQGDAQAPALLQAYAELKALSEVKYKPSNAGVPQTQPSDVFSRTLQQQQAAPPKPTIAAETIAVDNASEAAPALAANVAPAPRTTKPTSEAVKTKTTDGGIALQSASAYRATQTRNASLNDAPVDAVEKIANEN